MTTIRGIDPRRSFGIEVSPKPGTILLFHENWDGEMRHVSVARTAFLDAVRGLGVVTIDMTSTTVEQQVEALAGLIRSAGEAIDSTEFARRLVATGKVTVQS